ncbi:MAG: type VI secretion system tip protein VgrG [Planctomycetes bacterium]|jgi:type VI secretion system secreted protein VgrG|nr:type VI secretion system tip protein VgrG [Planctomycetota bacterium]
MAKTQQHRELALDTPLGKDVLLVVSLQGTEQLARPFELHLELVSEDPQIAFSQIVGQNVTLKLALPGGKMRYFNGFVSRFTQVSSRSDLASYSATVVPWLWFLTRTADCRIFQAMTVPDIIKKVFRDQGFSDFEDSLTQTYRTWEYCVQYRETDFNFVSRLMEQEGIYYFFKHQDGQHVLVLADSPSAHQSSPGFEELSFQFTGAPVSDKQYVRDWVVETRLQPGSCSLNAFDFKNTRKDLNARARVPRDHEAADFDVYDYSLDYIEGGDGESYARRRIEELQARYEVATGTSDARGLSTGCTFKLTDHPRKDRNREWLVTGVRHTMDAGEYTSGGAAGDSTYSCSLTAMSSTEPFRAARTTPQPTIPGPQTAMVVGPAGEEIHVDEFGRVKVQFHWDRYGKSDENSSCWIRVGQSWAGKQWGAIYTPRIGQEVIVEFLEGDPDHPIITGRVYNGQAKPPYDLPANKTMSTLKSDSTLGGGGSNEIRFEDKKGAEQVYVHAQKDEDIVVENCKTENVGNNETIQIGNNRTESVGKNETLSVGEDRTRNVGKNETITVGLNRTHTVGVNEAITVGVAQEVTVGAARTLAVGAAQAISVGADQSESVGKNYSLDVGKKLLINAGEQIVIQTGKASIQMKKDGTIVISGKDITVKGSGNINIKASKNVVIKGTKVLEN